MRVKTPQCHTIEEHWGGATKNIEKSGEGSEDKLPQPEHTTPKKTGQTQTHVDAKVQVKPRGLCLLCFQLNTIQRPNRKMGSRNSPERRDLGVKKKKIPTAERHDQTQRE